MIEREVQQQLEETKEKDFDWMMKREDERIVNRNQIVEWKVNER